MFLSEHPEFKDLIGQVARDMGVACFPNTPIPAVDKLHESKSLLPDQEALKKIKTAHEGSDLIFGDKPKVEEIFQRISKYQSKI